jgi:enoyl-CoA hydratase/carnithine racemase
MIVTGAKNSRAFSAGADLKEWLELYISPNRTSHEQLGFGDEC